MNRYDKIDPEIKTKWVEALRSGKYQQGEGGLRRTVDNTDLNGEKYDAFCCLGVLCDVVEPDKWSTKRNNGYWAHNPLPDGAGYTSVGYDLQDSIGLTDDTVNNLIGMNDLSRNDFKEIADWIEENL